MWYIEDDSTLDLDIAMIKRFARLKISAPMTTDDLPAVSKEIEELIQAF